MPRLLVALFVSLVLLASPRPARAQFFDPDNKLLCWSCPSHNDHFVVSAIFDLVIRPAPFLAKSWRQSPLKRIAIVTIGGTIYELNDFRMCATYHPQCGSEVGRGFGVVDIVWDAVGAAAVELAEAGVRKLLHR